MGAAGLSLAESHPPIVSAGPGGWWCHRCPRGKDSPGPLGSVRRAMWSTSTTGWLVAGLDGPWASDVSRRGVRVPANQPPSERGVNPMARSCFVGHASKSGGEDDEWLVRDEGSSLRGVRCGVLVMLCKARPVRLDGCDVQRLCCSTPLPNAVATMDRGGSGGRREKKQADAAASVMCWGWAGF